MEVKCPCGYKFGSDKKPGTLIDCPECHGKFPAPEEKVGEKTVSENQYDISRNNVLDSEVLSNISIIKNPAQVNSSENYNEKIKCPYCAEEIQADAIKCRFCSEFLNKEISNNSNIKSQPQKLSKIEASEKIVIFDKFSKILLGIFAAWVLVAGWEVIPFSIFLCTIIIAVRYSRKKSKMKDNTSLLTKLIGKIVFVKAFAIFLILIIISLGFFHIVPFNGKELITFFPKSHFSYSYTFVDVDEVVNRYNNQNLGERMRGNELFDNLVSRLKEKGIIYNTEEKKTLNFNF